MLRTTVIGITGSVGKTTTKNLLASVLSQRSPTIKTLGNRNARRNLGLEKSILSIRPWHKYAVIEIGVREPGDMASSARFLNPDLAIFLNVKLCHTDKFKDLQAICTEKSQILKYLRTRGTAILNMDDEHVSAVKVPEHIKAIGFGNSSVQDYHIENINVHWPNPLEFTVCHNSKTYLVKSKLHGAHWITAMHAVITTARALGAEWRDIQNGIQNTSPFVGRMQPRTVQPSGATFIRDEQAGSIDTLDAAIELLKTVDTGRKVFVFGDIAGTKHNNRKRGQILGRIAAEHADLAIFIGETAKHSEKSALDSGVSIENIFHVKGISEASDLLKQMLLKDDVVYVKGRTNQHLERIFLDQVGTVNCELVTCRRTYACDQCPELGFDPSSAHRG